MESNKNKSLVFVFFLLAAGQAYSLVSLQNGNYYYEAKPVDLPANLKGKFNLLLSYNSRSMHTGLFGYGWGTEFETRLIQLPEGAVVIYEIGGADPNRYVANISMSSIEGTVKKIMIANGRTDKAFHDKLMANAELRAILAEKFKIKGSIAPGTKLYNFRRKLEVVSAHPKGFIRYLMNEGREEYFDLFGRLYLVKKSNGGQLKISYNNAGLIDYLEDSQGRKIFLKYDSSKRIARAWSSIDANNPATFEYDSLNNLTRITFPNSNKESYTYDALHNMKTINYSDATLETIMYDRKGDWVTEVTSRDKKKIQYQQWMDPSNPKLHLKQSLTIFSPGGGSRNETYEYWKKVKAGGELWLSQMKSTVDGEEMTRFYDEKTGMPNKEVSSRSGTTNLKYNGAGLLTYQQNPDGSFKAYEYRPKDYKVTLIKEGSPTSVRSPTSKGGVSWVRMAYDSQSRVSNVSNERGNKVVLTYDGKDRIIQINDNKNTKIRFSWNADDRPVVIDQPGVGKVSVVYNSDGSIKSADSPQGSSVASQVSINLQKLLTIVQPAGVSL